MKVNRTILFVEDDAVVLTTYRNLLQREGFRIESAQDGLEALKALSQATPDLVVLDLMLPKFDGADVLKFIRADPRLKVVPIIIFSNAQITDFAEDAITRQLRKTDCTPSILVQTIQEMLATAPADASNAANAVRTEYAPAIKLHMASESSAGGQNDDATEAPADETPPTKERAEFLKDATADIAKVREHCLAYIKAPTSTAKLEPLSESVHSLSANATKAGCARIALLTKAFDMLLSKIASKPARVTPSILQTLAEAADCLGLLLKSDEAGSTEEAPRAKVLAVDDDTVCNHVIVNTLKRANLDIVSVEDPLEGLKMLQANRYDLVLLDIDMPKLTGFEVCEKLRALPHYKTTPVIFVTAHSNFGNRTQGVLSGGNYFIMMEPITFCAILFGASVLAGALGALLGLGGGVIIVPVLTLMAGLNIHYAIGASIVSVIATSSGAAATYVRDRITNLRLGMFLEMATTTGAVAGALVAGFLPGRVLSVIFGAVLLHAAWTMARSGRETCRPGWQEAPWRPDCGSTEPTSTRRSSAGWIIRSRASRRGSG